MGREDLVPAIRSAARFPGALLPLLVITLSGGCRETDPPPRPRTRAEATKLEKQGHSFAARSRPAWVDDPKGGARPASPMPAGWVPAGRGSWVLGKMAIQQTQRLAEVQALEGTQASVRAPLTRCPGEKTLVRLEDAGQQLVSRLPGELPEGIDERRSVVEGELRKPASEEEAKAAGRCLGKDRPALLLKASGVLVRLSAGGR